MDENRGSAQGFLPSVRSQIDLSNRNTGGAKMLGQVMTNEATCTGDCDNHDLQAKS
jgi:hypothetical protein